MEWSERGHGVEIGILSPEDAIPKLTKSLNAGNQEINRSYNFVPKVF
jgi:hypothetical protein